MAKLKININGYNNALESLTINGKPQKITKTKDGKRFCEVECEKETQISIHKSHFYTGKAWFWWSFLYFIVSIFGLFDVRQNKRCYVFDCKFNINVETDTELTLAVQTFKDGSKFAELTTDAELTELSNIQFFDKEAQKRQKKMKKFKIFFTIVAFAVAALLVVLL